MTSVLGQAGALLSAGRSREAVDVLLVGLENDKSSGLYAMAGYALYHDGRIGEARVVLDRGLARHPVDPVLHVAMARMLWMDGAGDAFAERFLDGIAQRPGDVDLRIRCAELLRQAGLHERAEHLLRDGLIRTPDHPDIEAWRGILFDEMDHFEEALACHAHSVAAFPGDPTTRLNLAHTLMRMGRADAALAEILPIRRVRPDVRLAITYEATALKQIGDPRHDRLCDYQSHVQVFDIASPPGFATVADFNAALGARLRGLMDARQHPLDQSLRGGSQTSHNLVHLDDHLVQTYLAALDGPIRAYRDALGDDPAHPLEAGKGRGYALSGCWSVLLRPGGFHVNHTHPGGWLSSSYYVSLPACMTADNQEGWIKFGEPRWPMPGVGVARTVRPQEGRLVLFPSYMWHGTIPFASGERLTAPFDVVAV